MRVETIIIGAGQAGLALSHHLGLAGHGHVVLERGRVGERWRSERWDSLTLLTPNWLNRLPGAAPLPDPDGYLDREGVIAHLERYAATAPVREGTTVRRVRPTVHGYHVATDRGDWHAAQRRDRHRRLRRTAHPRGRGGRSAVAGSAARLALPAPR